MDLWADFTHIPMCQRVSCELGTQTNVQRPCAYGSQSHRNKQWHEYSPRQTPANTEVYSFAIMCLGAGLWHWYFYKVQIFFVCFLACIYSVLWWLTMSLTPSDSRGKAEVYHSMFKAQNIRVQSCSVLFFVASLSSPGLNRPYWLHFIFMLLCLNWL